MDDWVLPIGCIAIPLVLVGEIVWNYLSGVLRMVEQIVCVKEGFLLSGQGLADLHELCK